MKNLLIHFGCQGKWCFWVFSPAMLLKYLWPIFKALCFLRCHVCHMSKTWFPACYYFLPTLKSFGFVVWLSSQVHCLEETREAASVGICSIPQQQGKVSLLMLTYWTKSILWFYIVYLRMFLMKCVICLFILAGSLKHTSLLIQTLRILKEKTKNKAKAKYVLSLGILKHF